MSDVTLIDNTEEVKELLNEAIEQALEAVGIQAEGYAKLNLETDPRRINTGNLRNSITYVTEPEEKAVYVGTNVEYGIYVHEGTGIYAYDGGGRQDPWSYQDDEGNWHRTSGMMPNRFLVDAAENYADEYRDIFESYLKG